jgi:hypothetical protein
MLQRAQGLHQALGHRHGGVAHREQAAHAQRGADGAPGVCACVHAHEHVAAKQRLDHLRQATGPDLLHADERQVRLKALALKVFKRAPLLQGLGVDNEPVHGGDM